MKKTSYLNEAKDLKMSSLVVLQSHFVKEFIHTCSEGYRRGFHERNGGNLSYRIKPEEILEILPSLDTSAPYREIGTEVASLANEYFLVTGSGRFLGNVERDPEYNIGIIQVDETGTKYKIIWGLIDGGKPTSELPTHLMNLEVVKLRSGGEYRVVYHCHATNLIALTYVLPLNDAVFSRELWESSVECSIVFPKGLGVLPFMVPGGRDIAVATSELMKTYDAAIWAHHGLFVTGPDFDQTFGLADTIEKAAKILVKVISMTGGKKLQTIEHDEFKDLARDFKVEINEEFITRRKERA